MDKVFMIEFKVRFYVVKKGNFRRKLRLGVLAKNTLNAILELTTFSQRDLEELINDVEKVEGKIKEIEIVEIVSCKEEVEE